MKIRLAFSLFLLFCYVIILAQPIERCMAKRDSTTPTASVSFSKKSVATTPRTAVNIPVVVHVVWNKDEENISEEQILSQIEVLNKDFNAENVEVPSVPNMFADLVADVDFHFCLASKDPDGNPTNGITRTFTTNNQGIGGTSSIHHANQGGQDAWDTDKYLNIWVAKFAGAVGGVASFPNEGPDDEQGVEINYKHFGATGTATNPPYNLGRTCTHEIGHYFNLEHLWGPNINSCCNEDDGVADTPVSCEDYLHECPTGNTFSCTAPDMWMNFMNYTDDACMAMFSKGQKLRMYDALNTFRPGLLESDGCGAVATNETEAAQSLVVYGNLASDELWFEVKSPLNAIWNVSLVNALGQIVYVGDFPSNTMATIDGTRFPNGFYILLASHDKTRLSKQILLK